MNKLALFLLPLLCLTLGTGLARAAAAQPAAPGNRVLLIFDASGSMWGQIDGKAKIAIAKEVMSGLIQELPATLEVGLTAYGHRTKGDCNDVEELRPLAPLDRNTLIATIRTLQPKGKTPIAHSIATVAEKLQGQPGAATIILVSDGEETCGGDPCKLVAELKKAGAEFVMHVVGFDVKGPVSEQLACIAKAGGGTYAEAGNAAKLKTALTGAIAKTLAENLVVRAVRPAKDTKGKPAPLAAVVTVFKAGGKVAENSGQRVGFKLEPGSYDLEVAIPALNQSRKLEKVTVSDKAVTDKEVPFTVSALAAVAKDSSGKVIEVYLRVMVPGNETPVAEGWTGTETPHLFTLPAGTYTMNLSEETTGQKAVLDNVVLAEGQEVVKELSFAMARLAVTAKDSQAKPLSVYVEVFTAGDEEKKVVTAGWTSAEEPGYFELPPGGYDLTVREEASGQQTAIQGVVLEAGAKVVKEVSFAKAKLGVMAKDSAGKPISVYVKVFRSGDAEKIPVTEGWTKTDDPDFFELPPATYDLTVREEATGQETALPGVVIAPGAKVVKELSFAKAKLTVTAKDSTGQPISAYVKVFTSGDEEKVPVTEGWTKTDEPDFFELPPATYDLTVREENSGQQSEIRGVVIAPGAKVAKEVTFAVARLAVVAKDAAGKPISAYVTVFNAASEERVPVTEGWTKVDEPEFFQLPPATYDIQVRDEGAGKETTLPGVVLEAGAKVVKEVSF